MTNDKILYEKRKLGYWDQLIFLNLCKHAVGCKIKKRVLR